MAAFNAIEVRPLLGKSVVITEVVHGMTFERRGVVTAIVQCMPGSVGSEAILLEEPGSEPEFYNVGDFTLHHVE